MTTMFKPILHIPTNNQINANHQEQDENFTCWKIFKGKMEQTIFIENIN